MVWKIEIWHLFFYKLQSDNLWQKEMHIFHLSQDSFTIVLPVSIPKQFIRHSCSSTCLMMHSFQTIF